MVLVVGSYQFSHITGCNDFLCEDLTVPNEASSASSPHWSLRKSKGQVWSKQASAVIFRPPSRSSICSGQAQAIVIISDWRERGQLKNEDPSR